MWKTAVKCLSNFFCDIIRKTAQPQENDISVPSGNIRFSCSCAVVLFVFNVLQTFAKLISLLRILTVFRHGWRAAAIAKNHAFVFQIDVADKGFIVCA